MKTIYSVMFLPFLIILLLVTSVIGSSEWEIYEISVSGIHSYNKIKVKETAKDIVQVWTTLMYSDEGKEKYIKAGLSSKGHENISHHLSLYEIDCKKELQRNISFTLYDTNGGVLKTIQFEEPKWSYIVPMSTINSLREKVCK